MGLVSFIGKPLGFGRRFNGIPEQYLAMVQYMANKDNPECGKEELLQRGEVMQKMMKVNLKPYQDFKDLGQARDPDYSMVDLVADKVKEIEQRRDLKQALYGSSVDLRDDDVMESSDPGAVFARKMMKDLSQHVQFPDEEQRKLKGL